MTVITPLAAAPVLEKNAATFALFGNGERLGEAESAMPGQTNEDPTLTKLMVGYQRGSLADFEEVYALLATPIQRFLNGATGDPGLAEELLVETFLEMHVHRRTYRAPSSVRRWALDIADYVYQKRLR